MIGLHGEWIDELNEGLVREWIPLRREATPNSLLATDTYACDQSVTLSILSTLTNFSTAATFARASWSAVTQRERSYRFWVPTQQLCSPEPSDAPQSGAAAHALQDADAQFEGAP